MAKICRDQHVWKYSRTFFALFLEIFEFEFCWLVFFLMIRCPSSWRNRNICMKRSMGRRFRAMLKLVGNRSRRCIEGHYFSLSHWSQWKNHRQINFYDFSVASELFRMLIEWCVVIIYHLSFYYFLELGQMLCKFLVSYPFVSTKCSFLNLYLVGSMYLYVTI